MDLKFAVAAEDWKARSRPLYARLHDLDLKAQDVGLTAEERREREDLKAATGELLKRFLKDSR